MFKLSKSHLVDSERTDRQTVYMHKLVTKTPHLNNALVHSVLYNDVFFYYHLQAVAYLENLESQFPFNIQLSVIGNSYEGRPIYSVKV